MTIRHVLFDADGVLQRHPNGAIDVLRRVLGGTTDERVVAVYADETPYLSAAGDFPAAFGERLRTFGIRTPFLEVHREVWLTIAVDPVLVDLVHRLRAAGLGVHLATNQHQHRGRYMRTELGYDDLFDTSWYSWEIGAAKPAPAYFEAVVAGLGAEPDSCLFIDDRGNNVRSASRVGLVAEQWTTSDGHEALMKLLASHGVLTAG